MKIVIDASAACEVVLQRGRAGSFEKLIRDADEVIAPELYVAEVANVLWKYVRAGELDLDQANKCLEAALNIVDSIQPGTPLIHEALITSCVTKHPVYDSIYLILARRNGANLLSIDRRLIDMARKNGVFCVEI